MKMKRKCNQFSRFESIRFNTVFLKQHLQQVCSGSFVMIFVELDRLWEPIFRLSFNKIDGVVESVVNLNYSSYY